MSEKDTAQQKRENYIDKYSKTKAFKELDKDKQEAILSLKDKKPAQMPQELENVADFENIITHFSKKLDSKQRTFYLKLFDMTKKEPDFILESVKDSVKTREYIKIYQHTQSKDLYYLAFTQQNDNIKITGIPTTQLNRVIKDITRSDKILKAEDLGEILQTAKPIENNPSPQLVDNIIPQKNNQSQALDMNNDSALKAIKNEVSNIKDI